MDSDWKQELAKGLVNKVPVLLIALGTFMLLLGAAGGIRYKSFFELHGYGQLLTCVAGVVFILVGMLKPATTTDFPDAAKLGIKILYPRGDEPVDVTDLGGTLKDRLPDHYTLWILRIFSGTIEAYAPRGMAQVDVENGRWEAKQISVGGMSQEKIQFGVYLVGPSGVAVLDYFRIASRAHRACAETFRLATGKELPSLPALEQRTPDMICCDRISVRRK